MSAQQIDDLEAIKARARATWMAGDYPRVARLTEPAANEFVARLQLKPGMKVLDVACGSGNLAIPAAKAGAIVTGIDIAPNLLDQARARAAGETLDIRFEEGDAEDLPFEEGAFDVVLSMFGTMFAPRPEVVAGELTRVCRQGGRIALASWTPSGFIGELFRVTSRHVPPPAGVPSPLMWGDENRRARAAWQPCCRPCDGAHPGLAGISVFGAGNDRVLPHSLRPDVEGLRRTLRGRPGCATT